MLGIGWIYANSSSFALWSAFCETSSLLDSIELILMIRALLY